MKLLAKNPENASQVNNLRTLFLQEVAQDISKTKMEMQSLCDRLQSTFPALHQAVSKIQLELKSELAAYQTEFPVHTRNPLSWGSGSGLWGNLPLNKLDADQLDSYQAEIKNILSKHEELLKLIIRSKDQGETADKALLNQIETAEAKIKTLKAANQLLLADELQEKLLQVKRKSHSHYDQLKKDIPADTPPGAIGQTLNFVADIALWPFHCTRPASFPFLKQHTKKIGTFISELKAEQTRVDKIIASKPPSLAQQIEIVEEKIKLGPVGQVRSLLKANIVESQPSKFIRGFPVVRHVLYLATPITRLAGNIANLPIDYVADPLLNAVIGGVKQTGSCTLKKVLGSSDDNEEQPNRLEALAQDLRERYKQQVDQGIAALSNQSRSYQKRLADTLSEYIPQGSSLYNTISQAIQDKFEKIKTNLGEKYSSSFWAFRTPINELTADELKIHEQELSKAEHLYKTELEKEFALGSIMENHQR